MARFPDMLAPYVPTPHDVVERMLLLGEVRHLDIERGHMDMMLANIAQAGVSDLVRVPAAGCAHRRLAVGHRHHALSGGMVDGTLRADHPEHLRARHAHRLAQLCHGGVGSREGRAVQRR
jgi:hypothetical protein